MKLLEKENVAAPVARAFAPAGTVSKPQIAIRTRVVSQPALRRRDRATRELCNRIVAFAMVLGVTYIGSTLMGYVALERARQTARLGSDRAAIAQSEAQTARAAIESLTNPAALHAWADAHGFVAIAAKPVPAKPKTGSDLVARR